MLSIDVNLDPEQVIMDEGRVWMTPGIQAESKMILSSSIDIKEHYHHENRHHHGIVATIMSIDPEVQVHSIPAENMK